MQGRPKTERGLHQIITFFKITCTWFDGWEKIYKLKPSDPPIQDIQNNTNQDLMPQIMTLHN